VLGHVGLEAGESLGQCEAAFSRFSDVPSTGDEQLWRKKKAYRPILRTVVKTMTRRKAETSQQDQELEIESTTTAIHIPKATWKLLRAVAFHRAQENGGRASVSKLITELVERHRSEFERETASK
jgi:hypothetical protein